MKNMTVSLFKGYSDTVPTEVSLSHVAELIRRDRQVEEHTRKHRHYREQQQPAAAAREKAACPCFAVSVRFDGGKRAANVCAWTGLCIVDIDHIPTPELARCTQLVRDDRHTLLAYVTIGGNGLRVVCRYEGTGDSEQANRRLHARAFACINAYYARLTGCACDLQCKNATRLSGLAHDAEVHWNPDAQAFTTDELAAAAASKEKPLPAGRRTTAERRLKRVVTLAERLLADEGVAYVAHHRNEYIMRTGYLLNAYGVPQEVATEWAEQRFADYDGNVAGIFRSCYLRTEEYGTRHLPGARRESQAEGGKGSVPVADIERFLDRQAVFRKNTVTGKCEVCRHDGDGEYEELTDRYVNTLWCRLCKEEKPVRIADLRAVLDSEYVALFDPFRHYFERQPAWDPSTDPIALLAARVHVKEGGELFATCFKKWLVAMVASLFDPEVVNHEILVLIGKQGIYKTTWLNNLLPPELRRYFYLKSNSHRIGKDDLLTLSEFAIVCLEELDEMEPQEVNLLKALTTMRHVNERAAYAHYKEHRMHIASFCGTGNNPHFLNDLSGNRRWMPFEVESIDSPYLFPVDYPAVYAQAYALYQGGFHYWLDGDELKTLNAHNRHFEVPCLERELILLHYRRPLPGEACVFVTNAQILARINVGIRQKLSAVKVGVIMKQEGYQAVRSGSKRGYRVVELTGDEIYHNQCAMARFTEPQ